MRAAMAAREISRGEKPDFITSQTKKKVFQLWERRSHRPILSLETTRKGPSTEPDYARQ